MFRLEIDTSNFGRTKREQLLGVERTLQSIARMLALGDVPGYRDFLPVRYNGVVVGKLTVTLDIDPAHKVA